MSEAPSDAASPTADGSGTPGADGVQKKPTAKELRMQERAKQVSTDDTWATA